MICQKKETSFWPYNSFWIIKTTIGNINKQELKAREVRVIAQKKETFPLQFGEKASFFTGYYPFSYSIRSTGSDNLQTQSKIERPGSF